MNIQTENATILTHKVIIKPGEIDNFVNWQAKLNAAIVKHPGFVSLEILSPIYPEQPEWLLVQRFCTAKNAKDWHQAEVHKDLIHELHLYAPDNDKIKETFSSISDTPGGITEVFITQVSHKNEKAYREWVAKIHYAEAKFPGFRGVYLQSPAQTGGVNWITLLRFDTPENLDKWLCSPERKKVLEEAKPLISSLETHRMISPYAGWFSSIAKPGLPPLWKQTMIVLLVLFPIVMLELKYLSLLTAGLNLSLATFIGNAISVTLISWPMMPTAIFFLRWWLMSQRLLATLVGTFIIILLYLIEIAIFWKAL